MRPFEPGMNPLGLKWTLAEQAWTPEPCNALILRKCGHWKAAALDKCTRKWAPKIGESGEISPFLPPLGTPLRFSQTAFSFAPDKRRENIPDPEEVISGQ